MSPFFLLNSALGIIRLADSIASLPDSLGLIIEGWNWLLSPFRGLLEYVVLALFETSAQWWLADYLACGILFLSSMLIAIAAEHFFDRKFSWAEFEQLLDEIFLPGFILLLWPIFLLLAIYQMFLTKDNPDLATKRGMQTFLSRLLLLFCDFNWFASLKLKKAHSLVSNQSKVQ